MRIDILNLECEILYNYELPSIGAIHSETNEHEVIPAVLEIYSVKSQGIEIINLITKEDLRTMEAEILDGITFRN